MSWRNTWDKYIDYIMAHTLDASGERHCDRACIIGMDGSKWTTDGHDNHLQITYQEAAFIARVMRSKDFTQFRASGIQAAGVRYQFLREEDGKLVLGKKKGNGALTLQASKTAIVIGHTKEGGQQGNTNKGVAVIVEYLESLGMRVVSRSRCACW
jgi:profilin